MTQIAWSPSLETGVVEIDDDHRQLVDLLNQLVAASDKPQRSEVSRILAELEAFTVTHFANEESLMVAIGYAATESHREEHRRLFEEVGMQIDDLNSGRVVAASVAMFMQRWLIRHIVSADRALGEALHAASMASS